MIRTIPRIKAINKSEQSRITKLNSPQKIQKFLDSIPYSSNPIYRCPLCVLKDQKAHCFDEAVFAAAILTQIGYKPLILDLYSRIIVGWQISERQNSSLVTTAIISALIQRGKKAGIIFHSAQGSQYASKVVRDLLATNGIIQSMSRKGNCYDNAVMESFFHTLKTELVRHENFQAREEAKMKVFVYIEIYYNRQRIHSSIDYFTPVEYENNSISRKVA